VMHSSRSLGGLGTGGYQFTKGEADFLKKINEKPIDLWAKVKLPKPENMSETEWAKFMEQDKEVKSNRTPAAAYSLAKQVGEYVGWFGIVREISADPKKGTTNLLLEHKYFDGLSDLH